MATPDNQQPNHSTTTINKTSGGGTGFVIGALVVIVLVLGYFMFLSGADNGTNDINVKIEGTNDAVKGTTEAPAATTDAPAPTTEAPAGN